MTAEFPDAIYSPRTKANRPGVIYTPTKTTVSYAEDIQKLDAEVVSIETELGENPKGTSASVLEKIKGIKSLSDANADLITIKGVNVGINNATPGAKLNIIDTVNATVPAFKVEGDSGNSSSYTAEITGLSGNRAVMLIKHLAIAGTGKGLVINIVATTGNILELQNNGTITFAIKKTGETVMGGTAPNANAILDLISTTKAFMPPRMTTTQRDNISTPTEGMVIYNLTTHLLNFYNGTVWGAV
jgi:hypothetical protein